jgi:hypothetical protein
LGKQPTYYETSVKNPSWSNKALAAFHNVGENRTQRYLKIQEVPLVFMTLPESPKALTTKSGNVILSLLSALGRDKTVEFLKTDKPYPDIKMPVKILNERAKKTIATDEPAEHKISLIQK